MSRYTYRVPRAVTGYKTFAERQEELRRLREIKALQDDVQRNIERKD